MEKFNSQKHKKLLASLPFAYAATAIYLDFTAYTFKRNNEDLIVWQDLLYPNEFPCIFLPQKKSNWQFCSIALATYEDIKKIEKESIAISIKKLITEEYYYNTQKFLEPRGKLKNRIKQFEKNYQYKISHRISKKKIVEFYNSWKKQRKHQSLTFDESENFFYFCVKNLKKYDVQQVYVIVDNKLVGFAWGVAMPRHKGWVGLHLKVDYRYKGLSRFLHQQRAKLFSQYELFTLGTSAHDPGIQTYKNELGPDLIKQYYYLLTENKK